MNFLEGGLDMQNGQEKIFTELPEDNFGLYVENRVDELKILWVANKIGEKKLRASANKRSKYYPESPLFISTIIKRFHLKIPLSVYSEVPIAIYRVYVLVTKDLTKVKIGMTGRWPERVSDFVKTANFKLDFREVINDRFDTKLSFAFDCKDEAHSRSVEYSLKAKYKDLSASHPQWLSYSSNCKTEWFSFDIYNDFVTNMSSDVRKYSLEESLQWSELFNDSDG